MIILTHTHYDHCQNSARIQNTEKCKIVASLVESKNILKGYTHIARGTNLLTRLLSSVANRTSKKKFGYQPFVDDRIENASRYFKLANLNIRILSTPGHTSGSISIIVDNEIALVGDTMFGIFKPNVMPPYAENTNELIKSWRKLLNTGCYLFLPGHGREIKRETLHIACNKKSA